jgi:riboflavin biosynthesis pyrimidine reductase
MDGLQLGPGPARCRRLRRQRGLAEYNLRVLVSGSGSINPQATIFTRRFSPILILTTERAGERRLAALRKVADEVLVFGEKSVEPKLVNCAPKPREILISPVAQPSSAASSGGVPPLAPPPGGTPTPRGLRKDGRDERARCMNSQVDFAAALAELRTRWGVRRLVCEGGGELNAALFAAGLVDELHLTICPFAEHRRWCGGDETGRGGAARTAVLPTPRR